MCRYQETMLPPEPYSVPVARSFLQDRFQEWGLLPYADDASLVLSELVTNAVTHGEPPVVLRLSWSGGAIEIGVHDASTRQPVLRPERLDLDHDLDELVAVEAASSGPSLGDRDPRADIGAAGSVVGGRGLLLVQELTEQWGATAWPGGGKAVWARTPVRDPEPAEGCRCATSSDAHALASGHRAEQTAV